MNQTERLNIRLTKEEKVKLKNIASRYGCNISEYVRLMIFVKDKEFGSILVRSMISKYS